MPEVLREGVYQDWMSLYNKVAPALLMIVPRMECSWRDITNYRLFLYLMNRYWPVKYLFQNSPLII